ncbi:hypothetical protein FI667_g6001, partial [Globisporangium splendens]
MSPIGVNACAFPSPYTRVASEGYVFWIYQFGTYQVTDSSSYSRSDDDCSGNSSFENCRDHQDTYGSRSFANKNDDHEDKSFVPPMVDKAKDMVGKWSHSHDQEHRDLRDDYDNDRNKHKGHNKHDDKIENKSFTAALFGE